MNQVLARLNDLRAKWAAASQRARIATIVAIAALAAAGILLFARGSEPEHEILFANLATEDAGRIVERLRDLRIPYRLEDEGTALSVPADRVHETRLTLAAEGLPSGGSVGFELFDRQRFGESEFAEQVQYRRALEGELARSIRSLAGVRGARVHLVLPQRTLFSGAGGDGASASVALALEPGARLGADQVRGIVHLVAGSVRDLEPARVTVVDGSGRRLSGGDDESGTEGASDAEQLRQRIEDARRVAIQELLDATLGAGVAIARVSADVTFAREERLEESYDPDRIATRSFEIVEEGSQQGSEGVQGVPGAVSALPGGAPAEPVGGTTGASSRRSEMRNFEITKVVRRAVEPVGRVTRLAVAVVVDGTWEGEGERRSFVPRSTEELSRIRAIVSSAAGIVAARGDEVTVECVPFASSPAVAEGEASDGEAAVAGAPWEWIAAGAGVLALLVVAAIVLARRRRRASLAESAAQLLPAPMATPALSAGGQPVTTLEPLPALERSTPDEIRKLSVEIARAEPQVAARVIRAWLSEGASS